MRHLFFLFLSIIFYPLLCQNSLPDQSSIYSNSCFGLQSSVLFSTGHGQWNDPNFWSDGMGNFITDPNDPNIDIVIQSGHSVTVTLGNKDCGNLVVQAGSQLVASSSANKYINIHGTSLDLAGNVGGTNNGLSFNIEGANCNLNANGNVDLSRLRKATTGGTTNLTIQGNLNLHFANTALYCSQIGANFNVVIDGNVTVNPGHVSIDGVDGTNSGERGGTFTINGSLSVAGDLYLMTDNFANDINYVINSGGQLSVDGQIIGNNGVAGNSSAVLSNFGTLILNRPGTIFTNLSNSRNDFIFGNNSLTSYTGVAAVVESTLPYASLRLSGGTASINGQTTVGTQLNLQATTLTIADFNISLASGATVITDGSTIGYVQTNGFGFLQQEVGAFPTFYPVGNTSINPVSLSNFGTTDIISVRVIDEVREQGLSGNLVSEGIVNRTWIIEEAIPGGTILDARLTWAPSHESTGFDNTLCSITRFNGTNWTPDTPSNATGNTTYPGFLDQNRTNITNLSLFTVESNNFLPAEWGPFNAREETVGVFLNWTTLREEHTDYFLIEWSQNGRDFQVLSQQPAMGYTEGPKSYHYLHRNPAQKNYYRLKLIDLDASESYSPIIEISLSGQQPDLSLYPTAGINFINLVNPNPFDLSFEVINQQGQLIICDQINANEERVLPIEALGTGQYYIRFENSKTLTFTKL